MLRRLSKGSLQQAAKFAEYIARRLGVVLKRRREGASMACSNFCTSSNWGDLRYSLGYESRSEERARAEWERRAEAIYQTSIEARQAGADPIQGTYERQLAEATDPISFATVVVPVLIELVITAVEVHCGRDK